MLTASYLILALGLFVGGCGPAISKNVSQKSTPMSSFADLQANPDYYQGKVVILGGEVMTVQPQNQGSLLAVSQRELNHHYWPIDGTSSGSFLVESTSWLSSFSYVPRRKVTVAGVVQGQKEGQPVLLAKEIHLWPGPEWEEWYYPIPRSWYDYDPNFEFWNTPPQFDPWRGGGGGIH